QSKCDDVILEDGTVWYKTVIGAVGVVTNGSTPSRKCGSYWEGSIPWVSSGEVRNNIIYQTNECITEEGYQNSSGKMLPKGTVLIAMIGEGKTRGQSAILDIEATTNQNIAAIIIEHGLINPKFMWYWLQKQYRYNREKGAGSGPQALNCQRVRELEFIVPSIEEQNKIVEIIDIMMEKETQVSSEIEGTIDNILSIKKSILEKAFRGELGTNNPCDEPSIELLKQVLAND
ncbi:restriction endonuclease subunit S, partial [Ruminococcus sp.]|uniref:restriction endonuclease subunit S n=1 Tax=Ruminococcus sp. TaxID=41978 RepID=UPI0025EC58A0